MRTGAALGNRPVSHAVWRLVRFRRLRAEEEVNRNQGNADGQTGKAARSSLMRGANNHDHEDH